MFWFRTIAIGLPLGFVAMLAEGAMPGRVGVVPAWAQPKAAPEPLMAPSLPHAGGPDEIAAIRIAGGNAAGIVTFAVPFAPGRLTPGNHLAARVNGHVVPVQVTVDSHQPDGSIKMATVSLAAPGAADVMLIMQAGD